MTDKRELALYFPQLMLREIQDHAMRTDRSMSSIVQAAWTHAAMQVAAADRDTLSAALRPYATGGAKRKQTLYYPAEMIAEFEAQAARLDASMSYIVQAAFALAKAAIEALPDVTDFPTA